MITSSRLQYMHSSYSHSLEEHNGREGVIVSCESGDKSLPGEVPGHSVSAAAPGLGLAPGPGLLHQLVPTPVPYTRVAWRRG